MKDGGIEMQKMDGANCGRLLRDIEDLASIGGSLSSASPAAVVAVIYVVAAIVFFISMRLSIGFMNKKEF